MQRALLVLAVAALFGCATAQPQSTQSETPVTSTSSSDSTAAATPTPVPTATWYKGNTHTHTLNSDGDTHPGEVANWYRDHDYDFLVLSDHNYYTLVDDMQREMDHQNEKRKHKPFLLIPGEEVSDNYHNPETNKGKPIHMGAVGSDRVVGAQGGASVVEVLQRCTDAIHAAGGLAQANHPNFGWALTADDLHAVKNLHHVEVFNGHPYVHNTGGSNHPTLDELWDDLLSRGRLYYGLATDDAHHFQKWEPAMANPGRGWICVRSMELTRKAIVAAIDAGDFYASTGVELDDVTVDGATLSVKIHRIGNYGYRTQFIGKNGSVLAVDETDAPSYTLKPGEMYVRAKITDSGNRFAWTQPLFAKGVDVK